MAVINQLTLPNIKGSFDNKRINSYKQMIPFRNKNVFVERPFFTHFASLPLIHPHHRITIKSLQQKIRSAIHKHPKYAQPELLKEHHHDLCHITLFKLTLRHSSTRNKVVEIIQQFEEQIRQTLESIAVEVVNLNYFTRFNKNEKCNEITVIYGELSSKVVDTLNSLIDKLMRHLLKEEVIAASELKEMNVFYDHNSNLYKPQTLHISLFRVRNMLEDQKFLQIFKSLQVEFEQIVTECSYFDLSTMGKEYDQTNFYLPLHRIHIKQMEPLKQSKQILTFDVRVNQE